MKKPVKNTTSSKVTKAEKSSSAKVTKTPKLKKEQPKEVKTQNSYSPKQVISYLKVAAFTHFASVINEVTYKTDNLRKLEIFLPVQQSKKAEAAAVASDTVELKRIIDRCPTVYEIQFSARTLEQYTVYTFELPTVAESITAD